jgi:hypothetical protein
MTDPTKVCPLTDEQKKAAREAINDAGGSVRSATPAEAAQGEVAAALQAAIHALRSYQYGNGAPDLAEEVADRCERALAPKAAL